ncbi:MAG TPA: hypothetical protein VH188_05575 [Chthoniobacterales bacterium]|jgi:hypothetical protein|nr:hypothetical protein [Chthoniobacterales bacterium]
MGIEKEQDLDQEQQQEAEKIISDFASRSGYSYDGGVLELASSLACLLVY